MSFHVKDHQTNHKKKIPSKLGQMCLYLDAKKNLFSLII